MLETGRPSLTNLRRAWLTGELGGPAREALAADARAGARALYQQILRTEAAAHREAQRLRGMLRYERRLWRGGAQFVAGVDEVGVGSLAGPVVAAAVVFAPARPPHITGLNDSKQVPRAHHARLAAEVRAQALAVGMGECSAREVDALGIFAATRLAAQRAVQALGCAPDHLLLDAHPLPALGCPQTALVQGDTLSQSIAAASVVAKAHRDAWMRHLGEVHPGYGFGEHAGYGTREHAQALQRLGPSPAHRRSFGPVRAAQRVERPWRTTRTSALPAATQPSAVPTKKAQGLDASQPSA